MATESDVAAAVARYRLFLHKTLGAKMREAVSKRDATDRLRGEYAQLLSTVEVLRRQGTDNVRSRVNLGSDFFARAEVPDASRLVVNIGLGFHAELTLDEIDAFVAERDELLQRTYERQAARVEEVAADMREVSAMIRKLAEAQDAQL